MLKQILNQQYELPEIFDENGNPHVWQMVEYVSLVLNNAPQQGFTLEQIEKRLAIRKAFNEAKDMNYTTLTAEQHSELLQASKEMRWKICSEALPKFHKQIAEAKEVNPNQEPNPKKNENPKGQS